GYRRDQIAHPLDGFGVLVPAVEKRSVLGVLFSSSLFSQRAPAGHVALTVLIGGARPPELASLPLDQLLATVRPDLTELLGPSGRAPFRNTISATNTSSPPSLRPKTPTVVSSSAVRPATGFPFPPASPPAKNSPPAPPRSGTLLASRACLPAPVSPRPASNCS